MTFDYFHSQHSGTNNRILGTETEYGIICPHRPNASPISTSTSVVLSYADLVGQGSDERTRWDFYPESPLRDTRGFDLSQARPTPQIRPNAPGMANLLLSNGGRFYVDHAHPEYSTPEVADPLAAVLWDKAGDRIAQSACDHLRTQEKNLHIVLYKNNVDGKGASYGTHENYTVSRVVPFDTLASALIPFFVTRIIFTGAGRIGLGAVSEQPGFQISQRADYIETNVSLETTLNRGIINTRDEPHADEKRWRRLHVIVGDGNMSELATYLKLGTTALLLDAIEGQIDFSDLTLTDPISSIRTVSRDLTLNRPLALANGESLTALQIQHEYLQRTKNFLQSSPGSFSDEQTFNVLEQWHKVLHDLATDPFLTADYLDWTAKLKLFTALRRRDHLEWNHPKLAALDFAYADISPQGVFQKLVSAGRMRTLFDEVDIQHAATKPPDDTRAWLRGTLVERFGSQIVAASWDRLIVETEKDGYLTLVIPDPAAMNRHDTEELVQSNNNVESLIERLIDISKGVE